MATKRTGICFWCALALVDGAEESGWTGTGPDWMTDPGEGPRGNDYGCDLAPESGEDGVGSHRTEAEVREVWRIINGDYPSIVGDFLRDDVWDAMRARLYGEGGDDA